MNQYPFAIALRFCRYTARVAGTAPVVAHRTEVRALNPTSAQLRAWMTSACRTPLQVASAPQSKFEQFARGLYWGLSISGPEDKKRMPAIRQSSGGQFVVAGSVVQEQACGGMECYCDGVAMLRERPGLPPMGYFALTETSDGKTDKTENDGELAECFRNASPKEWPGGSPAQISAMTRDMK